MSRSRKRKATVDLAVDDTTPENNTKRQRHSNLFDAVAGRVTVTGTKKDASGETNRSALAPEEALFRLKQAPERTQEDDFYWANRHIDTEMLPESDLLKVVHSFASDYYNLSMPDQGHIDIRSLEGSALLALGILLEETVTSVLGSTGDLAFVEAEETLNDPGAISNPGSEPRSSRTTSVGATKSKQTYSKRR